MYLLFLKEKDQFGLIENTILTLIKILITG
ncbi:Uncharacterised protein [Streptococcus pneumoniae]|nr:Uncharacterised protein [Streptococcus pneumoniae]